MGKVDTMVKRLKVQVLLGDIHKLKDQGVMSASDYLRLLILAEAITKRDSTKSSFMTKELKEAAKRLHKNQDITIRRADKTDTFILINTDEYRSKLNTILSDANKFIRIRDNPIEEIKKKLNGIIKRIKLFWGLNVSLWSQGTMNRLYL